MTTGKTITLTRRSFVDKVKSPLFNTLSQSVLLLSRIWLFETPWTAAHQASLSITNSQSPPKPMSIESVIPSNRRILCRSLLLLPLIFPSIRAFSNVSAFCIRWPEYWSFSFSINPSNEHPGLIFLRMDWLSLHSIQGTLKSLLQHHSSKASILQHSAFFGPFKWKLFLGYPGNCVGDHSKGWFENCVCLPQPNPKCHA